MYDENGDFSREMEDRRKKLSEEERIPNVYCSHETLENGISIKYNVTESFWIANVTIQEQDAKNGADPTFSIFQVNRKTRQEAIDSLYNLAREQLVRDNDSIFTLESRVMKIAQWLSGQGV